MTTYNSLYEKRARSPATRPLASHPPPRLPRPRAVPRERTLLFSLTSLLPLLFSLSSLTSLHSCTLFVPLLPPLLPSLSYLPPFLPPSLLPSLSYLPPPLPYIPPHLLPSLPPSIPPTGLAAPSSLPLREGAECEAHPFPIDKARRVLPMRDTPSDRAAHILHILLRCKGR